MSDVRAVRVAAKAAAADASAAWAARVAADNATAAWGAARDTAQAAGAVRSVAC